MPWSGVTEFVGRETELELLHQLLQGNHSVAIAAIAGMGGVGKTELALQYALKQREFYCGGICWCQVKSGDVGSAGGAICSHSPRIKPLDRFGFSRAGKILLAALA
ncbi:hypothetical protein [Tolypothrix sp. VBCCA 56010]|uniref:hypothetical protein n=1 Tax=Tolypothrix sp. VBCCA 56010 TaxID=3137731 RepID=UPI003D7E32DE